MIKVNPDKKNILYLLGIFVFLLVLFWGRLADVFIDCGREAYIPSQMLKGQVLYKDIFNVYGPFSYLFNAGLFSVFGQNLKVLYLAGGVASAAILAGCYILARNFVGKGWAFGYVLFLISACVFNFSMYNFIFPYSFSMIYSLFFQVFAVLFAVKYLKSENKSFFVISFFFAGGAFANKIEFVFLPILLFGLLILKREKFLFFLKTLSAFLILPAACLAILILQGASVSSLVGALKIIFSLNHTSTLKYFYTKMLATYYSGTAVFITGFSLLALVIFICAITLVYYFSKKIAIPNPTPKKNLVFDGFITVIFTVILWFFSQSHELLKLLYSFTFSWLPIFLTIYLILNFLNMFKHDKPLLFLIIVSVLSCLRGYYCLNLGLYGTSMLVLPLLSLIAILYKSPISRNFGVSRDKFNRAVFFLLIIGAVLQLLNNVNKAYATNNVLWETRKGKIYTSEFSKEKLSEITEFVRQNTNTKDKVLILPEGHLISFLSDRSTINSIHSLIPLYVEAFSEEKIIKTLKKSPPEYIILLGLDLRVFGQSFFCKDYAQKTCAYFTQHYALQKNNDFYKIYKFNSKSEQASSCYNLKKL